MQPPAARKIPLSSVFLGVSFSVDWFYLRDREHPDTILYLEAENLYTNEVMAPAAELERKIYEEMVGRIQETDSSVPSRHGAFEYYIRTEQGQQYGVHCRRALAGDSSEQILLNCNVMAHGREYFGLAYYLVSPDGSLMAFAIDNDGSEVYTLRFRDLTAQADLPVQIQNVYYSGAWTDNRNFFYTTLDETKRPYRLWRHQVGSAEPDKLVYEEPDMRFNISVERSRSGQFLLLTMDSHATSEVRYLPTSDPDNEFQLQKPRIHSVEYYAEHQGGFFWIQTKKNTEKNQQQHAPDANPVEWEEVIPHRAEVSLEGVEGFRDHLVIVA